MTFIISDPLAHSYPSSQRSGACDFYCAMICVNTVFAVVRCPSVRLSVTSCIVSRWLNMSSNFFLGQVALSC